MGTREAGTRREMLLQSNNEEKEKKKKLDIVEPKLTRRH